MKRLPVQERPTEEGRRLPDFNLKRNILQEARCFQRNSCDVMIRIGAVGAIIDIRISALSESKNVPKHSVNRNELEKYVSSYWLNSSKSKWGNWNEHVSNPKCCYCTHAKRDGNYKICNPQEKASFAKLLIIGAPEILFIGINSPS